MSDFREVIDAAKARLSIPALWQRLDLPGTPKASCKSPFREDRHASFSVSKDGALFNDFGTGEAGDAVDFLRLATGLSPEAAFVKFLEMAGGGVAIPALPKREQARKETQPRQKPVFEPFERGTDADLHALAALRCVDVVALRIESEVGVLRFAMLHGKRAWIVTDDERLNAQARRLDGKPWEHVGAKAWTLPGSWASHPIGLKVAAHYPRILLVEGGPDLLAASHFVEITRCMVTWCPVAMLGAGNRIPDYALAIFAGKRVRIYPHTDIAGQTAAERWAAQLATMGAEVDCFSFAGLRKADGEPVGDLNDCTQIHPEDADELEGLLP